MKLISALKNFIKGLIATMQGLFYLSIVGLIALAIVVSLGNSIQSLPDRAALKISPSGILVDQKTFISPVKKLIEKSADETETLLFELIKTIDHAANDKRITNLVLELDYLNAGSISKMEELGEALLRFKSSGKPIIAIGDSFNQDQYFLASYADEIHLNPMGSVILEGYGRYTSYLKEALDRLRININVFRVGAYKDAIEPFTRNNMSEKSQEHTSIWVNELWLAYTNRVESLRGLRKDSINEYSKNLGKKLIENGGNAAQLALNMNLVDKISNRQEIMDHLISLSGLADDGGYQSIDTSTYFSHIKQQLELSSTQKNIDQVALIIAKGAIDQGDQPNGKIGSESISQLLKKAQQDDKIKAVVLRIDSPGGGAFASEIIRQEILTLKDSGKPVIVSMGSVAASGGYWISMGATEIWATPTTITGSIGVFGVIPTFENTLKSIGINSDGIGTTSLSDIYQLSRPMSEHAKQIIQSGVDHTYSKFLNIVAEARNTSIEQVSLMAQGRVWSGVKALELGLVDKLGGLNESLAAAARAVNITDYEVLELVRPLSLSEKILYQIGDVKVEFIKVFLPQKSNPWSIKEKLNELYAGLSILTELNDPRGIYLSCFECSK